MYVYINQQIHLFLYLTLVNNKIFTVQFFWSKYKTFSSNLHDYTQIVVNEHKVFKCHSCMHQCLNVYS